VGAGVAVGEKVILAYPLGEGVEEPNLVAASITDKNGHILPYVKFQGGKLALLPEALDVLHRLACRSLENN